MHKKVVWLNGCFDILHVGHVALFKYARSLGDYLIVGTDTDERIKISKGLTRPVNKLDDRVKMLNAMKYIDKVVTFNSDKQLESQIKENNVNFIVIGSDYKNKKIIGSSLVEKVIFFERINEYSTTKTIQGIANR